MGKKNKKDSVPHLLSEQDLELVMPYRHDAAYRGMTDRQIFKALRKAERRDAKTREANAAAFEARRAASARFAPAYSAPRADSGGLSEEQRAAERLRRHSESCWQTSGNAAALRRSGS